MIELLEVIEPDESLEKSKKFLERQNKKMFEKFYSHYDEKSRERYIMEYAKKIVELKEYHKMYLILHELEETLIKEHGIESGSIFWGGLMIPNYFMYFTHEDVFLFDDLPPLDL